MTVRHQHVVEAPRRRDSGFMLLEVILAVTLLAISMVAIIGSLGQCLAAARAIQSYSTSEILLANKSFEFRTERPTDILDQEGEFDDYPGFPGRVSLRGQTRKGSGHKRSPFTGTNAASSPVTPWSNTGICRINNGEHAVP